MNLGNQVNLSGGTFTNDGTIRVGGNAQIGTTVVIGNFVMGAGGKMVVDINGQSSTHRSDVLAVTGTAALNGTIHARIFSSPTGVGDRYTIVTTTAGASLGSGVNVTSTLGFQFSAALANDNRDVELRTTRTGNTASLVRTNSAPLQQVAQILARASEAPASSRLGQIHDDVLLETSNAGAVGSLNRLVPHSGAALQQGGQRSAGAFANAMMSCASASGGEGKFAREEQCLYATAKYRELDRDATASNTGGGETSQEFMAGVQVKLADNWRLGAALGHEQLKATQSDGGQTLGTSEGGRVVGGLMLKNQWGPWNAYLSAVGGHGDFDLKRFLTIGGVPATATASQTVTTVGFKGRLAYTMDYGAWYAKPMMDVGATHTSLGGYTETGAGVANLIIGGASVWQYAFTPSIEIGGQSAFGNGGIFRPYVRAGVQFLTGSNMVMSGSFAAEAGLGPFSLSEKTDRTFALIDTGAQIMFNPNVGLKVNYEGLIGRTTEQHTVGAKLTVNY
jgi:uncharacterized protein with beta-barrel porin domain